ncbi:MAG: SDR family oxidoreductase [Pseudomonadota bacterium]
MLDLSLSGRTAVVCGSSQGLGEASAVALASQGANLVCIARNKEMLDSVVTGLVGERHQFFICDFEKREQVENIAKQLSDMNIDILVNNAGGPPPNPATQSSDADYLSAFQMHLLTAATLSNAVIPKMKEQQWGRIVNIVSVSGKTPVANLAVSNSVRGAVINWSKTLSNEVASHGITVNCVLPGYTRTSRLEQLNTLAAQRTGKTKQEVESGIIAQIPMGRFGRPEEIAAAVAFYSAPASSFVTGTCLPVDGGWTKFS